MRIGYVILDGIRKFVARVIFLSAYSVSKIQCFVHECKNHVSMRRNKYGASALCENLTNIMKEVFCY